MKKKPDHTLWKIAVLFIRFISIYRFHILNIANILRTNGHLFIDRVLYIYDVVMEPHAIIQWRDWFAPHVKGILYKHFILLCCLSRVRSIYLLINNHAIANKIQKCSWFLALLTTCVYGNIQILISFKFLAPFDIWKTL